MLLYIVLSLLLGVIFGTFSGLIPGIHINLIGVFLVSLSASSLSFVNPIYFVVFIVSMAITHTFLDFIPSIFLGCPDTDTELSILPGHELLKKGEGYEAILLTAYGGLGALFILILTAFPMIFATHFIQDSLAKYNNILTMSIMPIMLIGISVLLISLEKKKFSAFLVFFITGLLGVIILNPNEILGKPIGLNQPLLPLLTGLFGSSMILMSIKNKTEVPKQKINEPKLTKKSTRPLFGALIASPLCSFLPGLGSGQAAVIGNIISKTDKKGFLILLGATNTLVMGFSFIAFYAISKTRTGAAVAIKEIIGNFSWRILVLILMVVLISGIISFFLTKFLAKEFAHKIGKINYSFLSLITLIILIFIVFVITDIFGLIVLTASTFTGIYCISLKVRRTNMMGCLLLPTILFYLLKHV